MAILKTSPEKVSKKFIPTSAGRDILRETSNSKKLILYATIFKYNKLKTINEMDERESYF
jgi:hypothetical protein